VIVVVVVLVLVFLVVVSVMYVVSLRREVIAALLDFEGSCSQG
jgi:hypothetical protein